ncbi:MAG: hypothetical protein J6J17_05085 [Bacilli bacterium]|nr:hypothetical protein [Bacilli bacterium]
MFKKLIKVTSLLVLVGFSFFYTEKVTKIAREKDPIMIKISDMKESNSVSVVKPIINNDEYIAGINGCEINVNESYSKMKSVGEFKEELLVMKEVTNEESVKNKYIVGGNKVTKNVSIIFLVDDAINDKLINFLSLKNINANFFVDGQYLEKDLVTVKFVAENNNIYYLGQNRKYDDDYMLYSNNLISMNGKNESKYCLVNEKNDEILKLCSDYNMNTIKTDFITDNIYKTVKTNLTNGTIFAFDTDDIEEVKVSINYILSKGYNIVTLDKLLDESNKCD